MSATSVIHQNGRTSDFNDKTLYESLISACICVRASDGEAKTSAERVVRQVEKWIQDKDEVTTGDIRRAAAKYLKIYNPEAAYIYKQSRVMV